MTDKDHTTDFEIIDLGEVCEVTAGVGGSDIDAFGLQPAAPGLAVE